MRTVDERWAAKKPPIEPAKAFVLGFAAVIAIGTMLLCLPIAREDGAIHPLDSLFTASSAVCVTGLVVVDIAKTYTTFGEIVTMILIQIGGLGYMTAATAIALLIGRQVGIRERVLLREAHGQLSLRGMVWLTRRTLWFTLILESLGAAILALRFSTLPQFSPGMSIYYGIYHAISAFCNSGFDLMGKPFGAFASLTRFSADAVVSLTMTGLIIAGGLGFAVVAELSSFKQRLRLSLHSKLVLVTTAGLIILGTLLILALEWDNPMTLAKMGTGEKVLVSYFQSVTPRTAGFSTVNIGAMKSVTVSTIGTLMFIGASPGGTGGGIKTTTFILIVLAIWSIVKGKRDTEVFGRRILTTDVLRALAIAVLAALLVVTATIALTLTELGTVKAVGIHEEPFIAIGFEVISAFGTVGLSTGITPLLSPFGRLVIILVMFVGRVGPVTAIAALTSRERPLKGRLAEEHVTIG
ncbi:MAG TPA: potassium transporter TrkG [Armatimonadota bacterium]|nr:potassium transporter TrkG [Armatimonadota bacterium]